MKAIVLILIFFSVIKCNEALAILLPPNTNAINETEAIATKIKNFTDDLQEKSGLKIMKDINEFHEEPVFNEMFGLLRNFLTPYVATEDDVRKHIKKSIETKNSTELPQLFGHNGGRCSHKNRNSARKQEDYVQVWFLMNLPKNKTSHRNIEYLLEHFFEELVHDFEGETTPTPIIVESTQKILSSSEKTTLETTLDYHSMPTETDSTLTTTQTVVEEQETEKTEKPRIWNVVESNKRKRSVTAFKPSLAHDLNTVPFLRQLNNPLRAKRIKRDIQYISAPLVNKLEDAQLNVTNSEKEFEEAQPKNFSSAIEVEIINITNAADEAEESEDEATMEAENDNEVVVGDFGNTFLHVMQTERKKLSVAEKKNTIKQEEYGSAVKPTFCDALVVLLAILICCIH